MDAAFDALMRAADPVAVVVTAAAGGDRSGCLVGFHCQSSIEPRRYAVWLSKANHTYGVALRTDTLAVNVLANGDRDLAALFGAETGDVVDKFAQCEWSSGPGGVALLDRSVAVFVLQTIDRSDDGGDHVCFTGSVLVVRGGDGYEPLRFSAIPDIRAAHAPTERRRGIGGP